MMLLWWFCDNTSSDIHELRLNMWYYTKVAVDSRICADLLIRLETFHWFCGCCPILRLEVDVILFVEALVVSTEARPGGEWFRLAKIAKNPLVTVTKMPFTLRLCIELLIASVMPTCKPFLRCVS